jgi:hypothetical protein
MHRPFCILTVKGDVADADLHFVEAALTLAAARRRVKDLLKRKSSPDRYVIYNAETGELSAEYKTSPRKKD